MIQVVSAQSSVETRKDILNNDRLKVVETVRGGFCEKQGLYRHDDLLKPKRKHDSGGRRS